jgi:hypothetical protein
MTKPIKSGSERGGAMVELVVLMLVFVPLIMLPMYFQDAFRYKLDYQEAVSGAAWDFAFQNYEDNSIDDVKGAVEAFNQEINKNLWTGNTRAKRDPAGPWADFDWENKITCKGNKDFGKCYTLESNSFHGEYTRGGLASCEGSISISNHYIPRVFLQEFAQKNLFDPGKNALKYPDYKFGLMVDPWCVTGCEDQGKCPRKKNETKKFNVTKDGQGDQPGKAFYERAEYVWKKGISAATYWAFYGTWLDFCSTMWMEKIANPGVGLFLLDNPTKLKMTTIHDKIDQEYKLDGGVGYGGRNKFWTNPYKDGSDDKYEETYKARKSNYLGCKKFGPNCQ